MKNITTLVVLTLVLGIFALGQGPWTETVDCGVCNAKAISLPAPEITDDIDSSGTVVVRIKIDREGNVSEANAESGRPQLRSACEIAAAKARFQPFLNDGQPVTATGMLIYNFGNGR